MMTTVRKHGGSLSSEEFAQAVAAGRAEVAAAAGPGIRAGRPFPATMTGADGRERLASDYIEEENRCIPYKSANGEIYYLRVVDPDGRTVRSGLGLATIWHVIAELVRQNEMFRVELGLVPLPNPLVTIFQETSGSLNAQAGGLHDDKGNPLFPARSVPTVVEETADIETEQAQAVLDRLRRPKEQTTSPTMETPPRRPGRPRKNTEANVEAERHRRAAENARRLGINLDAPTVKSVDAAREYTGEGVHGIVPPSISGA